MKVFINVFLLVASSALSSLAVAVDWTRNLTFETGSLGVKAEGGGDLFDGAAGKTLTDCGSGAAIKPLKGKCAQLNINTGDTGFGVWGGVIGFPQKAYKGETIWYLVHTYMPTGFDYHAYAAGNRLKFLRIHTADSAGKNIGYNDIYFDGLGSVNPLAFIYEGELRWSKVGGAPHFPVFDQWESYEVAVTLDTVPVSQGGKALIRFWKNGVLVDEIRDRITLKAETAYADGAYLFTYWNGGAPKTQSMYVDEITVTNKAKGVDLEGNTFVGGLIAPTRPKAPAPSPK